MVSRYVEIKSYFGYNSLRANYIQEREISIVFFQNYIIDIRFRFFTRSKAQFFSIRRNGATIATQDRDTCAVSSVVSATMRTMHLCMRRAAKPNLRPSLLRQNASSQFLRVRTSYFLLPNNKRFKRWQGLSTFHLQFD